MSTLLPPVALVCLLAITAAAPETVTVTIDRTWPEGVSRLELGVTHTQRDLDTGGDPAAIARAGELISATCRYQNVHIMGWGTMNPNPAPGVYDWESLDRRMKMVRAIPGTVPVITLCAAPDWMKGGEPGKTDWSRIEAAPVPEHFADFAELAATIARRYPDVKNYQVWNEFKGFWDREHNNWNFEQYTRMYNLVYDALKAVNKEIQVGGPYLVIEGSGSEKGGWATEKPIRARQWEVLDYWLKNKHGADFFVIDRGLRSSHDTNTYPEAEHRSRTPLFGDIVRQIRQRTELPIWYAEFYAAARGGTPEENAAVNASVLLHMVKSGVAVALLWGPMGSNGLGTALFSDVRQPDGGAPTPLANVFRILHDHFGPNTPLFRATSSAPDVEVLASARKTLLVNKRLEAVTVSLDGKELHLAANEVRLLDAP
jgi:hypothetical protein